MELEPLRGVLCPKRSRRIGGYHRRLGHVGQRLAIGPPELERPVGLRARPGSPPRAPRDGGDGREARGWTASSGRRGPNGARDAPRRSGHCSPGSGRSCPDAAVPAAAPAGSCASGRRHLRPARPCRAASPPGSRRTPAAATFPRKRARPPPARIARAWPDPRGPRRPRGPRPDSAPLGLRDRARDAAPFPPAAPARPPAAADTSGPRLPGRWPAGRPRWRAAAGTASRGRRRGPEEQRANFRRQPPSEDDGAVLILVDVQGAARVLARGLMSFGLPVQSAPAPHDALHVGRRAGAPDGEQSRFGLPGRDAGQRADLGVGQLAARQRLGQAG